MATPPLSQLPTTTLLKMALKAKVKEWFWPTMPGGLGSLLTGGPRTDYNYRADLGDGLSASVIMPVIQWLMRSFPEAPLVVRRQQGDELEIVDAHPMVELVNRPNDFYPGTLLWMTTVSDWCWFGESFWRILPSRGGRPGELWWLPPWSVDPKWPQDNSAFISHYEYHPTTGPGIDLSLDEVLHFRHGLDPRNPRRGLPPLRAIMADIWADSEASHWVNALLRNMAVPGVIVSPKADTFITEDEVERIKEYIKGRFTGVHRGEPMTLTAPIQLDRLSWSPGDMDLTVVRNTAEERVSAALGVPAAVVGFGTGLEQSKVGATMREYVGLAWSNGIVPVQRLMAAELQRVLLPQFELDADRFVVGWNYDEVQALQEDENALAERYVKLLLSGGLKKSELRQALGYESTPEDDIYLHPNTHTATDPADQMPEPEPVPALPAMNGNGNGNGLPVRNGNGGAVAAVERRALKQGGTLEDFIHGQIQRHARRVEKPPQGLVRLANRVWRAEQAAQAKWQALLLPIFTHYSAMVAVAAREVLVPRKQDVTDIFNAMVIQERVPFVAVRAELAEVYEKLYEEVTGLTLRAMEEALHAEPTDPARIQAHVRLMARERVALMDLPTEARTQTIAVLEKARESGLGEDDMVRLLAEKVPAGRWHTIETRAEVIARSESRFASNLSTSEYARQLGAKLLTFDARLGNTDAICEERNGWIVSPAEAAQLAAVEHANGTLAFAPINQTVMQQIGATE